MIRRSFMCSDYYGLEGVPGSGSGWTGGGTLEVHREVNTVESVEDREGMHMDYRTNMFAWYRGILFEDLDEDDDKFVERGTILDCCRSLTSAKIYHLPPLQLASSFRISLYALVEKPDQPFWRVRDVISVGRFVRFFRTCWVLPYLRYYTHLGIGRW